MLVSAALSSERTLSCFLFVCYCLHIVVVHIEDQCYIGLFSAERATPVKVFNCFAASRLKDGANPASLVKLAWSRRFLGVLSAKRNSECPQVNLVGLQEETPFAVNPVNMIPRRLWGQHPNAAFLPCGSRQRSCGKPIQCLFLFPICGGFLSSWCIVRVSH